MSEAAPSARRGTNRRSRRESYRLPELLAEIADVAGLPAALAIAQVRGGTRTHFPSRCADDHWLTAAVGREAANKICDHFTVNHKGGLGLMVPLGPTRLYDRARFRARTLIDGGYSIADTARALGITTRSVETWNAEHKRWLASRQAIAAPDHARRSIDLDREYAPIMGGLIPGLAAPATESLSDDDVPGRNLPTPPIAVTDFPPLLAEIAIVAGLAAAAVLAWLKGGRSVHITDHDGRALELDALVGSASAGRLRNHFEAKHGGEVTLLVPAASWRVTHPVALWIADMREAEHEAVDIADWIGTTPDIIEHLRAYAVAGGSEKEELRRRFPFVPADTSQPASPEPEP